MKKIGGNTVLNIISLALGLAGSIVATIVTKRENKAEIAKMIAEKVSNN